MRYPVLTPVPIPMKDLSFFMRIWTWLFSVRKWELVEDWTCRLTINGKKTKVFIEKGFVFDGASVPRIFWWLLQPMGILLIPGLVHDYAYRNRMIKIECFKNVNSRLWHDDHKYWDRIFRDISIEVNECKFISYTAWIVLRLCGGLAWKSNRKKEKQKHTKDWKTLEDFAAKLK